MKNVIVGTSSSSPSTLQGLAASPEFFEYQISHHVFDMLTSEVVNISLINFYLI